MQAFDYEQKKLLATKGKKGVREKGREKDKV